MKKLLMILLCCGVLYSCASRPRSSSSSVEKMITNNVSLKIKGMVCDSCANGLKKVFMEQPAISSIKVSYPKESAELHFKKNQGLSKKRIMEIVEGNGLKVMSFKVQKN